MWLLSVTLSFVAALVVTLVSLLAVGWLFAHPWGYGVALAFLCFVAFMHWRRHPEHLGGPGYLLLRTRVEWLQEKDTLSKG